MNPAPPGDQFLTMCGTSASWAGGWDLAAPSETYETATDVLKKVE